MPPSKADKAKIGDGGDPEIAELVKDAEEKKTEKAKLPPPLSMAPLQQHLQMNSVPLVDIPFVYLNDRASWPDFKRAVTECGLIWNLSEWMTTIVYKGTEWKLIHENGTDLSTYFPVVEKTGAGDGKISKTSALGTKLVALLQRPTTMGDLKPSALFCCLNTVEFEDDRRLPARQKLWN